LENQEHELHQLFQAAVREPRRHGQRNDTLVNHLMTLEAAFKPFIEAIKEAAKDIAHVENHVGPISERRNALNNAMNNVGSLLPAVEEIVLV
jgi:hypothetical protein